MKCQWEAKDIIPGRRVGSPARSEQWMIGYYPDAAGHRYGMVSLSDGMIQRAMTADELAAHINQTGDIPAELFEKRGTP